MSAVVESQVETVRPNSWRDKLFAEYEISQANLRCLLAQDDAAEEYL